MADWIQMGRFVKVSAGIGLASGAIIIGAHIRGKHLAEPFGAAAERGALWDLFGDGIPGGAEYLSARWGWSNLYDDTMAAARAMATNRYAVYADRHVYWLQSAATGNVCSADSEWCYSGTSGVSRIYSCSFPSNLTDEIMTSATIATNGSYIYSPGVSAPFHPLAQRIYDYWNDYELDYSDDPVFDGDDNFWIHIGNSTNVYKYSCEKWNNPVNIDLIAGGGFTADSPLDIPEIGRFFDAVFISSDDDAYATPLYAGLFELTSGDLQPAYVVITDNGTPNYVTVNKSYIDLSEGGAAGTFTLKPNFGLSSYDTTVYITTEGNGFSVDTASHTWPAGITTAPITVTVTPVYSASTADQCGIIALQRVPPYSSSVRDYIAVRVADADGGNNDIRVENSLLSVAKGDEAETGISLGTNGVLSLSVSKFVRTNNLREVMNVLSNLDDTVLISRSLEGDYRVWTRTIGSTSAWHDVTGGESAYTASEAAGLLNEYSDPVNSYTASTNYAGPDSGDYVIKLICDYSVSQRTDDYTLNEYSGITATIAKDDYSYYGCHPDYPCMWAITNGYVNSYKVYGVFKAAEVSRIYYTLSAGNTNDVFSFDGTGPDKYESYLFGKVGAVRSTPPYTSFPADTESERTLFGSYYYIDAPMVLLGEVDCSSCDVATTNYPSFNMDFGVMNITLSAADYQVFSHEYTFTSTGDDYEIDYGKFDTYIKFDCFVIVVDWNWKFMDDGNYYQTNNAPVWVTNNIPAS